MSQRIEISQAAIDAFSNKEELRNIQDTLQSIDGTLKRIEKLLTPVGTGIAIPVYIDGKKLRKSH
ncbi:MAG: hypothetical protein IJ716_08140 [Lachnospiraceae bacterium]|nr:hypothetical protein [Lachnospiraceae bacterium]